MSQSQFVFIDLGLLRLSSLPLLLVNIGANLVGAPLLAGFGFVHLRVLVVFFVVVALDAFVAFGAGVAVLSIIAYLVEILQDPHLLRSIPDQRRPSTHVSA